MELRRNTTTDGFWAGRYGQHFADPWSHPARSLDQAIRAGQPGARPHDPGSGPSDPRHNDPKYRDPKYRANGDELRSLKYALSFSKGLAHSAETGLVANVDDYELSALAVSTPAQQATMPPAPSMGSPELTAEMTELYALALLRDMPLVRLREDGGSHARLDTMLDALNELMWFRREGACHGATEEALLRRRVDMNRQTAFRGIAPGDDVGPYISQLLLIGNAGLDESRDVADGRIHFGAQVVSQKIRHAEPRDYLVRWDDWLAAQNGQAPSSTENFFASEGFITRGRDLATYTHDVADALTGCTRVPQAYLNACLILLARGVGFDPGVFVAPDHPGRAQMIGSCDTSRRVTTLLGEVAALAQQAAAYERVSVHRRMRPEELAARLHRANVLVIPGLRAMRDAIIDNPVGDAIIDRATDDVGAASMLLPVAYPEGAPTEPSYGSDQAAVAGACVTILKAFFDHTEPFDAAGSSSEAFVASDHADQLQRVGVFDAFGQRARLSVEGELNKLAGNIAMGGCWAGTHYFSDSWESMLLGEDIALRLLEEHRDSLPGGASLTIPCFDGTTVEI